MAFIDEATIRINAGNGGNGCSSFYRDRVIRRGKPDGGPGGKGGDVLIVADVNVQTLLDFYYRKHFRAPSGGHGSSNHKKGANGDGLIVRVPVGTMIRDQATGLVLRDLSESVISVVIAKGGAGGRGNSRGREATRGEKGEARDVTLELRLIADVGLVGYPNAGKSTLISRISNARPKIADYPFTTLEPILGVVEVGGARFVVADIPGLIEGAHAGRGLGDRFLRHIERTKVLIHVVDIAALNGRIPHEDFRKLNNELELYSAVLAKKPQVIALNKIDLGVHREHMAEFRKRCRKKVYPISSVTGEGIEALLKATVRILEKTA